MGSVGRAGVRGPTGVCAPHTGTWEEGPARDGAGSAVDGPCRASRVSHRRREGENPPLVSRDSPSPVGVCERPLPTTEGNSSGGLGRRWEGPTCPFHEGPRSLGGRLRGTLPWSAFLPTSLPSPSAPPTLQTFLSRSGGKGGGGVRPGPPRRRGAGVQARRRGRRGPSSGPVHPRGPGPGRP